MEGARHPSGAPIVTTHKVAEVKLIPTWAGLAERKTVTYNDNGDPILEVSEHEERELAMDDDGRLADTPTRERAWRMEARFHYEYDAHGNWLLKTVESRPSEDRDFTPSSVERRSLTYFE